MTEETTELSFREKIIAVQNELYVPKDQFSKYGDYNYRSCEDILKAVKPLNQKFGLLLTLTDKPVVIGERFYIQATATLSDGTKEVTITAYAREAESKTKMDPSQVTGSASSYARKYALNGLYLIDDAKDADASQQDEPQGEPVQENLHDEFIQTFNKYVEQVSSITNKPEQVLAANALGKYGYDDISQVSNESYQQLVGYLKTMLVKAEQKFSKQTTKQHKTKSWRDF